GEADHLDALALGLLQPLDHLGQVPLEVAVLALHLPVSDSHVSPPDVLPRARPPARLLWTTPILRHPWPARQQRTTRRRAPRPTDVAGWNRRVSRRRTLYHQESITCGWNGDLGAVVYPRRIGGILVDRRAAQEQSGHRAARSDTPRSM